MAPDSAFELLEVKDCRKYRKHIYRLARALDDTFINHFKFLGSPVVTPFRQYVPNAHDLLTIRSEAFDLELSGGLQGDNLYVTFGNKEQSLVDFLEDELRRWMGQEQKAD
ncbi:MAG: hypothetical protein WA958_06115 [Tunicatimonas sp.]